MRRISVIADYWQKKMGINIANILILVLEYKIFQIGKTYT